MIYLGIPVLTEDPNRRDVPTHALNRSKLRADSVTGAFIEVVRSPAQQQVRPFSWFIGSRADLAAFRAFRNGQLGRLNTIWVPTWQHDVFLAADIAGGAPLMTIKNTHYTRFFWDPAKTYRRYLAFIQIGTGISFIRKVINASEDSPTQETLTLDVGVPSLIGIGAYMVSFLTYCRLEDDTVTIHYHLPTLAEAVVNFRELPVEMP